MTLVKKIILSLSREKIPIKIWQTWKLVLIIRTVTMIITDQNNLIGWTIKGLFRWISYKLLKSVKFMRKHMNGWSHQALYMQRRNQTNDLVNNSRVVYMSSLLELIIFNIIKITLLLLLSVQNKIQYPQFSQLYYIYNIY